VDELQRSCALPRSLLEVALRNLQDRQAVIGVMVADMNYPAVVIGVTQSGRAELTSDD
jgi:hypothetical protein